MVRTMTVPVVPSLTGAERKFTFARRNLALKNYTTNEEAEPIILYSDQEHQSMFFFPFFFLNRCMLNRFMIFLSKEFCCYLTEN